MNSRLFQTHAIRHIQSLDRGWTYTFPKEGTKLDSQSGQDVTTLTLPVPGVWESHPDRVNYRGQAIASTALHAPNSGPARLVFQGVSHTCRVFLDGKELGGHHNAFTAFAIDIAHLSRGQHTLDVWISNEHGEISALHIPNDYYCYGGISRPVEVQYLNAEAYIGWVHAVPQREGETWTLAIETKLVNLSDQPQKVRFSAQVASVMWEQAEIILQPGTTLLKETMPVTGVEAWSPDNPKLYSLEARLETDSGIDDWRDRIGFRTVAIDGHRILLNGDPIFLKGFNRHEDHPDYGCAIPVDIMRKDIELCRQMGANAIRTSHYPNDPRFLDLCDEVGLMVWEENHARGLRPADIYPPSPSHPLKHPKFREQCQACNEEMVTEHFNHPSIIIWGILNECESDSEFGRDCYQEQFEQIRSLDVSRPTTFASCLPDNDMCQDLPDICGWNFYANWYDSLPVSQHLNDFLAAHDARMGGKPMILSEFGGGALPGYRDPIRKAKWSEERQAEILQECLEVYLNHPRLAGVFVWQFCDVRVDQSWAVKRPRTMNNKGVVDEHRRPKLAFETVREFFRKKL